MNVIFIILHSGYGDLLYNSLLFKALKYHNKNIKVEVFTTKAGLELYASNPYIDFISDKFLDFNKKYDFLIDTTFKGISYIYSFLTKAENKVSMVKKPREKFLSFIYNTLIDFKYHPNEIKNTLQILKPVIGEVYVEPYFPIIKENPFKAKKYVLISPTAPVPTKIPDITIFNEIAKYVYSKGYDVIFSYPTSEGHYVKEKLPFAIYLSEDIHTFASILKDAKVLISCETFSYHLAGFLNVHSLVFLGAYPMWKISSLQEGITLNLDCQYCGKKACPLNTNACLNINPQKAIQKLDMFL